MLSGKVLVTGGERTGPIHNSISAEVYNPMTGKWLPTAGMSTPRAFHTATLLNSGQVLVVGGTNDGTLLSSAELYQP